MALPLIRALVRPSVDARRLGPLLFRSSRFLGALVLPQCAFYSALKGYPVPAPTSTPGASAASAAEVPVEIRVRKADKALHLRYASGRVVSLPTELLRVKSLSSDNVRTDSQGIPRVVGGRRHVGIMKVELVGQYGIRLFFDDLHDSGIFSYEYLDHLGRHKLSVSREYLRALRMRGLSRDPPTHGHRRGKGG